MNPEPFRIVVDVDGTLTMGKAPDQAYSDLEPNLPVVDRLREYAAAGAEIVVATSRNVRTFQGNLGLINVHTAPVLLEWLRRHRIPHHELWLAKPWPGPRGFYVDDRSVRPNEFVQHSPVALQRLFNPEE